MAPTTQRSMSPLRFVISAFGSQWFLVPQGTGIVAIILHQLDYQFDGLHIISYLFWVLAIVLLALMVLVYMTRCVLFPKKVAATMAHNISELAGLSSIIISFTSITQMIALSLVSSWGPGWGIASYALWWINVALAIVATVVTYFVFTHICPNGIPHVSLESQLPLISALTAAAAGGTISGSAQLSPQLQVPAIIVSYLLVGLGLPLAFLLDTLFWARLVERATPDEKHTFQDMILCGPWGQASFALQGLGTAVQSGSFASYSSGVFLTAQAASPVGTISIFLGLLAWGLGTFWWLFAILSILYASLSSRKLKATKGGLTAWSMVFPWGVYTNAAVELGKLLDSKAFKVWSTVLAVMLVIIWLVNMGLTVRGVVNGTWLLSGKRWRDAPWQSMETARKDDERIRPGARAHND